MAIEHVGLVTRNMEGMKEFYTKYFGGEAWHWQEEGTGYELYFLSFPDGNCRIELQKCQNDLLDCLNREGAVGLGHVAFMVKSKAELHRLTEYMMQEGVPQRTPPTAYGTDFYESSFWDPDGNIVEIAVGPEYLKMEAQSE